jgi:trans-aconitate methyltransferase
VESNYRCRPYKQKIVAALNKIPSNGAVDLGCGLGEIGIILRKSNSVIKYYGLDRKVNVISAAKFLSRHNNNKFSTGSFESLILLDVADFNTLLVINLAHRHDPKSLVELIMSNISVNIRYLLIDAVNIEESHNNAHKHSADKLIDSGLTFKCIRKVKNIDKYRDLLVFERESLNV